MGFIDARMIEDIDGQNISDKIGILNKKTDGIVNVKEFGAKGDGVTDDTAAIQAAIDYAKNLGANDRPSEPLSSKGAKVLFPPGIYMISQPLIMPRSGNYDSAIIYLEGYTMSSSVIKGTDSFPTGRALIEWESVENRTYWQSIRNLTFRLPNVLDTKAIWYKPVDMSTIQAVFSEYLHGLTLENITVEATNTHHKNAILLEGLVRFSKFTNIRANFGPGASPTYSTILLEVTSDLLNATSVFGESTGMNYSMIHQLLGMGERGGYGTLFKGRLYESEIHGAVNGNGALGDSPAFHFKNSYRSVLTSLASEGRTEKPQYLYENCVGMNTVNISVGTADAVSGDGIQLINCVDCIFQNRYASSSAPSFSYYQGKFLKIDSLSKRNIFKNFQISDVPTNEIQIDAPVENNNYLELFNVKNNQSYIIGSPLFERKVTGFIHAASNTTQTIPTGVFTRVQFNSELTDTDSIYDNVNSTFTPKKKGLYRVTVAIDLSNTVDNKLVELAVRQNGSIIKYLFRQTTNGTNVFMANASVIIDVFNTSSTYDIVLQHNFGVDAMIPSYGTMTYLQVEYLGTY
jgi:hypothetical protein